MRTTTRILIGMAGGPSLIMAIALGVSIAGCPHNPPPTPISPPDASDAARPKPPSCQAACDHAETVCPGSCPNHNGPALAACNRIQDPNFARCLASGADCAALTGCDPLSGTTSSGPAPARGR